MRDNMCVLKGNLAAEDVKTLRQNGLWVSLWFLQNAGKAKKCLGFGADASVTDHVTDVRAALGGT